MAERSAETLAAGLAEWARLRHGADVRVSEVRDLGGHSGDTFGFTLTGRDTLTELVARVAPAGVKHSGSTDVLRQAPLLRTLREHGAAVAEVVDAFDDSRIFDAPCLIVTRLAGKPLIMGPDAGRSWMTDREREAAHRLCAGELARINAVDPAELAAWEEPRSPTDEIRAWDRIWDKSPEPNWSKSGLALRDALLGSAPASWTLGVCHGDFQTNNVLFECQAGTIAIGGVVDWEVAHLGAVEHDLAWFLMMNDAEAWDPVELRGNMEPRSIAEAYQDAAGRTLSNLSWFQALACYRIAAIAAYNIRLHRSGRRPDIAWERASRSMPRFFERAQALLEAA
jgi:aminoglycoside phosphotransferase (APT) family kinase protein